MIERHNTLHPRILFSKVCGGVFMSKKRRRSARQVPAQNKNIRSIKSALIYGTIGFVLFLISSAFLAVFTLKSETPPAHMHIAIYTVYGCTVLLCGILCTARKREPIYPNCFFAGFTELLLVLLCAVIASKAKMSVYVCVPIALSLVCPILGGIVGRKI